MDKHPHLSRMMTQNLAQCVLHLMKLVKDLSLRTVEARLARLVLAQSPTLCVPGMTEFTLSDNCVLGLWTLPLPTRTSR